MARSLVVLTLLSLLLVGGHGACLNPQVTSQTYSTSDELMSSETVFIVEVEVECKGSKPLALHALVGDQLLPVAKSVGDNKYQLSWNEPHTTAKVGKIAVDFYDDEGATSIKKAMRYDEEISTTPLFTVDIEHKGVRHGGWLAPSFIAACVSLLVWWMAYATKGKLQE